MIKVGVKKAAQRVRHRLQKPAQSADAALTPAEVPKPKSSTKVRTHAKKAYKKVHHHVAQKPHDHLLNRSKHYAWWHSWEYKQFHHGHVHRWVLGVYSLFIIIFLFNSIGSVFAASVWTQDDWSGGIGSSTQNQYSAINNLSVNNGTVSITPNQKITNTGFETNTDGWRFIAGNPASFGAATNYASAASNYGLATADIDKDGDSDILSAHCTPFTIKRLLNNGTGTFTAGTDIANGNCTGFVVTGDFNKDGAVDIATTITNNTNSHIQIYINNGSGTFATGVTYPAGNHAYALATADLNNDGNLDIATANYFGNSVSVFLGNANGTFNAKVDYAAGSTATDITLGDIDNNGTVDVIVAQSGNGRIGVLKNNGQGVLAARDEYLTGTSPRVTSIMDVNQDGHKDIVVPNNGSNTVSILTNSGSGTFTKSDLSLTGPYATDVGDIDNDGIPDLVVARTVANSVAIYRGIAGGGFASPITLSGAGTAYVKLSDFNNDGALDIVTTTANQVLVYMNTVDLMQRSNQQAFSGQYATRITTTANSGQFKSSTNAPNTNHTFSANVYTNGGAVTTSDVGLFVGSNPVTPTITATAKPGWYRVSGTVVSQNGNEAYGIEVKANKTVYIDDVSLADYDTGTLTSNILDTDYGSAWGSLTYTSSGTGETSVKVRSGNNSNLSDAPAFSGCEDISSGTDLSSTNCVEDNHAYIQYEVTLEGSDTTPTFESISVSYLPYDTVPPNQNASDILMRRHAGGDEISNSNWTNGTTPYFEWQAASDADTGVKGYCLYLGTDSTADPRTAKGLLGTSPLSTNDTCQFAVAGTSIDTAAADYLGSALSSSNDTYYLSIMAIDNVNNVYDGDSEQFEFKFDNSPPKNPTYVSAPSQFVASKDVTLTWPTSGGDAPGDSHSGLAGLQYRIGDTTWYGDAHTGSQDSSDLLVNDGSYTTHNPTDYDNLIEGNNVVSVRAWDEAGNVSSAWVTTVIKLNTTSPSSPLGVQATPSTNTSNAFAFSWSTPSSFIGPANALTYCYTVNTAPTINTCTFTNPGVTSLPSGAYATQPGENTFYVAAKDEAGNINYATASTTTFTANTSAPGIPLETDVADVSVKATSSWRLAITWDEPTDTGAGIASYRIYRSTDNANFNQVASTGGTSYVDSGLTQTRYFYKVRACDSANNCGAYSAVVDDTPTGRFTEPATLVSDPRVSNISTRRAVVNWATNRESDSRVAIGTKSGQYSSSEIANSTQTSSHQLELSNLLPDTTYFLKAMWTDGDGNTGTSSEMSFKTSPAPSTQEVTVPRSSLNSALVRFTSVSAAKVVVQYGESDSFGGVKEISTSLLRSTYDIELNGLNDGTKYFYRLNTFDADGNEYIGSTVLSFTTPARPRIQNLRFQPLDGEPTSTQVISWTTNVPTSSLVRLTSTNVPGQEITESSLKTEHEIVARGLVDDTIYSLVAESRDAGGNLAVSDTQALRTALDTRPPKISDIVVETSVRGLGAEARGQIVVSWRTDEPSTSQVAFAEGTPGVTLNNKTSEDASLTMDHVVVISDIATSQVYSVQPISTDQSGNAGLGEAEAAIIGRASNDVITIVLTTIRGIFGF